MTNLFLFSIFLSVFALTETELLNPAISDKIISTVNSNKYSTWIAGENPHFKDKNLKFAKALCGVKNQHGPGLPLKTDFDLTQEVPKHFDPRDEWPDCKTIKEIRDQGECGSCWAIATVEAISDRYCIHSKGEMNLHIAVMDMLSCCGFSCGDGCDGGFPPEAYNYWKNNGLVTGGVYDSNEGCWPYAFRPCEHHVDGPNPPCSGNSPTPPCDKSCINGLEWTEDKHYAKYIYGIPPTPAYIQIELLYNGPVGVTLTVYEDLLHYKSGVYQHVTGAALGGHAVKLLGWGEENGVPYWLIANSWNTDWGDNGTFKILRGKNECGIEDGVDAGIPLIK